MRSHKRRPPIGLVMAVLLSAAGCSAQAKPAASVRMASPAEVSAVRANAGSLLPKGTQDARFDDNQAVTVGISPQLVALPVSFKIPMKDPVIEGQMLSLCGVIVTPQGGISRLVVTLGTGNTEMMSCTGVKAIGGAPAATPGTRPDLILIYDTYTGRESLTAAIVLTWDTASGTYAVDDALSQWLGEHKSGRTVAGARRLLESKRRAESGK